MDNIEAIRNYYTSLVKDLEQQNPKFPADKMRTDISLEKADLIGPNYIQYMIFGRGPGKMPPLDNIIAWVEKNIENTTRENKDGTFSTVPFASVAYAIAVKIGKEGTDIYQGKKKGLDLLGPMEKNMPELLKTLAKNELIKIKTSIQSAIR